MSQCVDNMSEASLIVMILGIAKAATHVSGRQYTWRSYWKPITALYCWYLDDGDAPLDSTNMPVLWHKEDPNFVKPDLAVQLESTSV